MFGRLISTTSSWFTVPVRLALGIVFIAHGSQKVLGAYGGPGLKAITSMPAPLGLRPAWLWMGAAAFSEFVGGILVLLGLLTRVGAFLIACVMLVAVVGVHWPNFFSNKGGYEYAFALFAMALALLIAGGGQASIDKLLMSNRRR